MWFNTSRDMLAVWVPLLFVLNLLVITFITILNSKLYIYFQTKLISPTCIDRPGFDRVCVSDPELDQNFTVIGVLSEQITKIINSIMPKFTISSKKTMEAVLPQCWKLKGIIGHPGDFFRHFSPAKINL